MPSPVYRGDSPGFQTQAVGNYPAASDVANKDNIYLTDEGWVYRHFKSADKSKYWDEIIWAGDVTNPPTDNNPVDAIDDASPTFLVGDGVQYVQGPYPTPTAGSVVAFTGSTTLTGTAQVGATLTATATTFTGGKGTTTTNLLIQTSDNGTSGWSFLSGDPGVSSGGSDTYTITSASVGKYLRASYQVSDDDGTVSSNSAATSAVIAAAAAATVTSIGTAVVSGASSSGNGGSYNYTVATASATATPLAYTWTVIGDGAITSGTDTNQITVLFTYYSGSSDISCEVTSTDADVNDSPKNSNTVSVTVSA